MTIVCLECERSERNRRWKASKETGCCSLYRCTNREEKAKEAAEEKRAQRPESFVGTPHPRPLSSILRSDPLRVIQHSSESHAYSSHAASRPALVSEPFRPLFGSSNKEPTPFLLRWSDRSIQIYHEGYHCQRRRPTFPRSPRSSDISAFIMESSYTRRMRAATEGSNITSAGIAGPSSPTKRRPREESWSGAGSTSVFGGLLGGGPPSPSKKRIYGDR